MIDVNMMIDEVLALGADDWVGIWELPWVAKSICGAETPADVRDGSLEAIRRMVIEGRVQIGDVTEGGFVPWPLGIDDQLARVEREWRDLPGEPSLGDIGWLNVTETGDSSREPR